MQAKILEFVMGMDKICSSPFLSIPLFKHSTYFGFLPPFTDFFHPPFIAHFEIEEFAL